MTTTAVRTKTEDLRIRKTFGMTYPALTGDVVMQGHADYCTEHGHAQHSTTDLDGATTVSPYCPRCGELLDTPAPAVVSIEVHAGATHRVSAQTAVNDHTLDLTPGTYPLAREVRNPEGHLIAGIFEVPATTRARNEVTASFGGVPYASRNVEPEATTAYLRIDGYYLEGRQPFPRTDITIIRP